MEGSNGSEDKVMRRGVKGGQRGRLNRQKKLHKRNQRGDETKKEWKGGGKLRMRRSSRGRKEKPGYREQHGKVAKKKEGKIRVRNKIIKKVVGK